ncbi:MAG: RagB/SusD family nutrient uptake outer membrane protein [Bacteroidales bacterium]|nr:RagB/SusD family nutrient uptake outer membrane protein [Bacteroidales bacterium]
MKKIILLLGVVAGLAMMTGCDKFLTPTEYGAPTEELTSQEDIWKMVLGIYSQTSNDHNDSNAEAATGRGIMYYEGASDNYTIGNTNADAFSIRNFTMTSTTGRDQKEVWREWYRVNGKCNNVINLVKNTPGLDQNFANKAMGTALFWRGLAMLWIAPYYGDNGPNGGIPIVLEDTNPAYIDVPRPASILENYDQMYKDFTAAADLLPYFSELPENEWGLPHKGACWAFAARVALYASEYDSKYYNDVITMCDKVMGMTGSDKRDLYTDSSANPFASLWTRANNYSCEYLFSLVGSPEAGPKFHNMSFVNGGYNLYNSWGLFQPSYNLYQAFEEGDLRRAATFVMPGETIRFMSVDIPYGGRLERADRPGRYTNYAVGSDSGFTWRKFMWPWTEASWKGIEFASDGNYGSNTLGQCLMRYADVLLMKAEALIWTKGEGDSEAISLLNQIRKRAGLPQDSRATKAQLKNERRCELAHEYMPSRWRDIIRWGDAKELISQPTLKIVSHVDMTTNKAVIDRIEHYDEGRPQFDPTKNHVFAIPSYAFDGLTQLKQNEGYN